MKVTLSLTGGRFYPARIANDAFTADFEKGAEENWVAFHGVYVAAPFSRG